MNCQTCQAHLHEELDGGAPAELREHLESCPECKSLFHAARVLQRGLRRMPAPVVPPGLGDVIFKNILADRRARQRLRWLTAGLAAAAAILLAIGIPMYWPTTPLPSTPNQPGPMVEIPTTPKASQATPSLQDSMTEMGTAVVSLTSRTAEETVGQSRLLLPVVSGPVMQELNLDATLAPMVPLREAGQGLAAGLEPVSTSARRAIGLFLRDLPPLEAEAKPGL